MPIRSVGASVWVAGIRAGAPHGVDGVWWPPAASVGCAAWSEQGRWGAGGGRRGRYQRFAWFDGQAHRQRGVVTESVDARLVEVVAGHKLGGEVGGTIDVVVAVAVTSAADPAVLDFLGVQGSEGIDEARSRR